MNSISAHPNVVPAALSRQVHLQRPPFALGRIPSEETVGDDVRAVRGVSHGITLAVAGHLDTINVVDTVDRRAGMGGSPLLDPGVDVTHLGAPDRTAVVSPEPPTTGIGQEADIAAVVVDIPHTVIGIGHVDQ